MLSLSNCPVDRRECDHLEEMLADALANARATIAQIAQSPDLAPRLFAAAQRLRSPVERRRLLTDEAEQSLAAITDGLRAAAQTGRTDLIRAIECAERARALVIRIRDLLAAETDIGWHRGIGR